MRGSRLPDDWRPPESIDPHDFGMTDHEYADQAARFRDYWRAVPGAKGRKSDWPATWRNWLRRAADNRTQRRNERPDPLDKLTAREANHARALAGADIAARQRWEP